MSNSTKATARHDAAWRQLLELARQRRDGPAGHDEHVKRCERLAALTGSDRDGGRKVPAPDDIEPFVALYAPLLRSGSPFAIAHLGQSIDGCIATASGHSLYVTGEANLTHLHRLRALCDAVLIGAGTAATDDPRLTVRRVPGDSPVRVVIDPRDTLSSTLGLFTDDGPRTLVVVACGLSTRSPGRLAVPPECRIEVPHRDGRLAPRVIRGALADRGLRCLFLEGGGVTVSTWLQAGALERLHVAIAPVIIGEGRRGLSLPSAADMPSALRPAARVHRMGEDVLFDLDLRAR